MMHFRFSGFLCFLFICFLGKSQPPCGAGTYNVIISPNLATYCVGDDIRFSCVPVNPYNIQGVLTWKYSGTANALAMSGPQNFQFNITGVQTGGNVKLSGQLNGPGPCTINQNITINVASPNGLAADAGPDLIYGGNPVTLGPAVCATGGNGVYTYVWSPTTGFGGPNNVCGPSVSPPTSVSYTLTVTDGNHCVARDEVFVLNLLDNISYIVPKKSLNAGFQVVKNNKVYFKFEEEYKSGTLNYKITDYEPGSANVQAPNLSCSLSPGSAKTLGDNRYYIDLSTCSLTTLKYYLVEITTDKNEKFYFKFKN